jgi:head-tail adaptor
MNPGKLNQVLTIYRRESSKDSLGQVSNSWVKQPGLIWARLMKSGGGSTEQADRESSSNSLTFRARLQSQAGSLQPDDRISWRGDQHIIKASFPVGDGDEWIEIELERHAD